jgi:predicted ATPase
MLSRLAIYNYRSLRDFVAPLERLNLVTGPNASGKSNVYRAPRLLADLRNGTRFAGAGRLDRPTWHWPAR